MRGSGAVRRAAPKRLVRRRACGRGRPAAAPGERTSSSASAASVSRCGRAVRQAATAAAILPAVARRAAPGAGCDRLRLQRPGRSVAVFRQRNGARQRLDPRRPDGVARDVARRGDRAHDIGFDDDVGRPADHQQMLDIVAPDQDEPAAAVDAGIIDDGKPRLAAARIAAAEPAGCRTGATPTRSRRSARARCRNARKKRTASGISAPNKLSNIRTTPRFADGSADRPPKVNSAGNICRRDY